MTIHLQTELDKLRRQLFHLSSLVEENFTLAVRTVLRGDATAGDVVRRHDLQIDHLEVEVEEECLKILALHQPVAVDLRFLIAALKMNNDLERIGDLAVNIANGHASRAGQAMPAVLGASLQSIADKARTMLRQSLEALMAMNTGGARNVLAADDEVDAMYHRFAATVIDQIAEKPADRDYLISWLMAAKSIERVADLATNIAEETIYSVDGEIVRHGLG